METNDKNRKELFTELYNTYVDAIFRFCYFKTGNREVAKDISQDVFMKFLKHLEREEVRNPKSFIYAIAHNTIIDYWRKSKSVTENSLPEGFFASLVDANNTENAHATDLLSLLDKLSPSDQEVINLRFIEDMSSRDMAEVLNERENTVLVRINRAKERLKNLLEKQGKSNE